MSSPVIRAKEALGVETDTALAKALGVAQSVIGGYNRRNTVPLEQCVKIAERTGVSLDWLILGKGEMKGGSGGDGVFVVRMGNALRVKRLQWLANGDLRISSDNPIYQTEQITPADLGGDFDILGACHTRISRVG